MIKNLYVGEQMRKKVNPKISVVMAAYNAEKYLHESIESILNQTFTDFEFIIINDGSIDKSLEIIESYNDKRIILINQKNSGVAKARNVGIEKSQCKYIAILDADDIAKPSRLKKQYEFLNNNLDYIVVGSNAEIINCEGNFIYETNLPTSEKTMRKFLPNLPTLLPSIMFRKSTFYKAGQYPGYMLAGEDTVLFNKMAKFGKIANIKEPLIQYRIIPTSLSTRSSRGSKRLDKIVNSAIECEKISTSDYKFLKSLTSNRNSDDRYANYHIFLAKKYLRNNYHPQLARNHLLNSLKYVFHITSLFYYFFSFLPEKVINKLYEKLK